MKTRVLIVEDSLTVRKRLVEILSADPTFELVGEAEDGKKAIELCLKHRPDVITMDMMLPVMSGLAATEYIMAHCPTPIVIVSSSINRGELFKTYEALAAGAVDVLEKPTGGEPDGEWERRFLSTVRLVSRIRVITHPRARLTGFSRSAVPEDLESTPAPAAGRKCKLVAIGASTGGPGAIVDILRGLPPSFHLPILFVLHINEPFGTAFADWLDGQSARRVAYPQDGDPVVSAFDRVVMAPAGRHLIVRDGRLRLTLEEERHSCRPSVDVLFESVAAEYGASAAGCLLTGMGRDGAAGLLQMRRAGGTTIAQDEATSVVYGMPREAVQLGGAERVMPLGAIAAALVSIANAGIELLGGPNDIKDFLIVDDSLTVRMNLAETLNAAGLETVICATAGEARTALADEQFSLLILDILLPDADGIDLLKEIRAMPAGRDMAVMLLSTENEVRDRVRGLTTGANEFIGKPYDPTYLVARAREMICQDRAAPGGIQGTILIIDDSPTFREELKAALEEGGYRVYTAGTGEDGLRDASAIRPDAIIVDGELPGIDGATVVRRIRLDAALRRLPCLLLTASDDRGAELRALDAGADAFVKKGDDTAIILARLAAMLRGAGAQIADRDTVSLQAPKKILAVDDSETYLQELASALRGDGYEVVLARSGEEALELLAVQPVDCILLDILMPGIGGQETCRRVRSSPIMRNIPIVMLTALEDRDAMIEGLGAGADDYIAKSSDFEVLRARVLAQIRRKQFEDENRLIREELLRKELEAAEARAARELAGARAILVEELERKNKELEAFSYSVSHDLRAPLRSIDGFSQALLEDYADVLDATGQNYLRRVRTAAQRMGELIDDLLQLSQVGRAPLRREHVDLSALARAVAAVLQRVSPRETVGVIISENLVAEGDTGLLRIVLENLLGNAWKFTANTNAPTIELGTVVKDKAVAYFVRDNGAGFDMTYANKLFAPFQRLHSETEFPGTGIGLATVQRIVERHGGTVWAEGEVGKGAAFFWTLSGHGVGVAI